MNNIVVQGLGFVGSVLSLIIASLKKKNNYLYKVKGLELDSPNGKKIVDLINNGKLPIKSNDKEIKKILSLANKNKNYLCTTNIKEVVDADILISTIHLDIGGNIENPKVNLSPIKKNFKILGSLIKPNCVVVIETTVPPGTCEKIILPILKK